MVIVHLMPRVSIIAFVLLGLPGLCAARRGRISQRALEDLGPRVGHCGYTKVRVTLRGKPRGKLRGKLRGSPRGTPHGKLRGKRPGEPLPPGTRLKVLAVKGAWLQVGLVEKRCFGEEPAARGWVKRGQLLPIYLVASERRREVPKVSGRALYAFDRRQMVLRAFGRTSPTLEDESGQGIRVWTTGDRRYPLLFHTEGWDKGPGSLTLFGPRRMLSLTSPGTRFTMRVAGGGFMLETDHLCLKLGLRLELKQLTRRRCWPRRFEVARVGLRGAKKGQVRWLAPEKKTRPADLPVVAEKLAARDARKARQQVTLERGAHFRPVALRLGEGDGEPSLEVELIPSRRRVLLDQQQIVKTTLFVLCAE
jgi:hypothetical protein